MIRPDPEDRNRREFELDSAYLKLHATIDPAGVVVVKSFEIRDPNKIEAQDLRRAERRAAICGQCDQSRRVSLVVKDRPVYTVKCKQCGCGGLSLIRGKCPREKW